MTPAHTHEHVHVPRRIRPRSNLPFRGVEARRKARRDGSLLCRPAFIAGGAAHLAGHWEPRAGAGPALRSPTGDAFTHVHHGLFEGSAVPSLATSSSGGTRLSRPNSPDPELSARQIHLGDTPVESIQVEVRNYCEGGLPIGRPSPRSVWQAASSRPAPETTPRRSIAP